MNVLRSIADGHRRLKERIHGARFPLGARGRFFMGCVYFTVPIAAGYVLMEYYVLPKQKENMAAVEATKARMEGVMHRRTASPGQIQDMLDRVKEENKQESQ